MMTARSTGFATCSSRSRADSRSSPTANRLTTASIPHQSTSTARRRIALSPSSSMSTSSPSSSTPVPALSLRCSPRPRRASLSNRHRFDFATRALTPDAPPDWTLDQIAGLVFGLGMVASVFLAYKVDLVVARQQRRQLGLCELCGGLNDDGGDCPEKDCPRRRKK